MEGYLHLGALILLIAFGVIAFEFWRSRRRLRMAEVSLDQAVASGEGYAMHAREPVISQSYLSSTHIEDIESTSPARVVSTVTPKPAAKPAMNDLLVMSVWARPDGYFAGYDLLQAISAAGMRFGEMNIFHYHTETPKGKIKLFSLASATEPGDFNMDRMGDFSCNGLTLFLDLQSVPDPKQAFDFMLQAAEQLAEDLDGELRAGQRKLWTEETLAQYQDKVFKYQITHRT